MSKSRSVPAQERRGGTSTEPVTQETPAVVQEASAKEEERGTNMATTTAPVTDPVTDDELREAEQQEDQILDEGTPSSAAEPDTATDTEEVSLVSLSNEVQEIRDEIGNVDEEIAALQTRRKELLRRGQKAQVQVRKFVTELEGQFGELGAPASNGTGGKPVSKQAARKPADEPVSRGKRHEKSIRVLILEYLEKHREARTSEIRKHLQSLRRFTNPGVELSRMVSKKEIINKDRGVYTLGKKK